MALRYDGLMKRYYTIIVTVFAIANFLFAASGGWLLYETVRNYYHATTRSFNPVVVAHSLAVTFFTMTWINGIFLCLLIFAAVLLVRFRLSGITFCMTVFAVEIGYFMATTLLSTSGISWFKDVGGAEGIGNMGLAPQILTGYPLIGLISLFLIRRNLRRQSEAESSEVVLSPLKLSPLRGAPLLAFPVPERGKPLLVITCIPQNAAILPPFCEFASLIRPIS